MQEETRISNRATYWPVAPIDVVVAAPLLARLLLGATPVGRVVQGVALGAYLASAISDWRDRRGIRPIDFETEFGADVHRLVPMPPAIREAEVRTLAERLNDEFTPRRIPRRELAGETDRHLTKYIAGITGQQVRTSAEVRGFALVGMALPFALGVCDILTGDVVILKDTGIFEPHIIAHEFSHRKGYWKELRAQALAYLALTASGDPVLTQSALFERLHRNLRVLSGDDGAAFNRLVERAGLRSELRKALVELRPPSGAVGRRVEAAMRRLYDKRMSLTGQNGISDYDLGFTNFLYTFETSASARQKPSIRLR
ncbi:MAG TPA: DUF3810 family protein [Methylomirabilota bacterium]|jgi:hypothetical protein|nr:DUF3810 family protein [Methylomirabilota bacterium]